MNYNDIKNILEAHYEWLDSDGASGVRAELSGVDLSGADVR